MPGKSLVPLTLLAGSGLLFATALRRWRIPRAGQESRGGQAAAPDVAGGMENPAEEARARQMVWLLVILLLAAGLAPQWLADPFGRALARMFFLLD